MAGWVPHRYVPRLRTISQSASRHPRKRVKVGMDVTVCCCSSVEIIDPVPNIYCALPVCTGSDSDVRQPVGIKILIRVQFIRERQTVIFLRLMIIFICALLKWLCPNVSFIIALSLAHSPINRKTEVGAFEALGSISVPKFNIYIYIECGTWNSL